MPANITLRNVPAPLYHALKRSAEANGRSMNKEAISCLEKILRPKRINIEKQLARIRKLRESLPQVQITDEEIDRAKREGRP